MKPAPALTILGFVAAFAAFAGCGAEAACPVTGGEPAAELGLSGGRLGDWEGLPGDGDGVMEIGPQGGFHLWSMLRLRGVCVGPGTARYEVRTKDTDAPVDDGVAPTEVELDPDLSDGAARTAKGVQTFVCPASPPTNLVDRPVIVSLEVEDAGGHSLSAQTELTLRCPTDHPLILTTCHRICDPGDVEGSTLADR